VAGAEVEEVAAEVAEVAVVAEEVEAEEEASGRRSP